MRVLAALVLAGWSLCGGVSAAAPLEAHPLTRSECAAVREMLEQGVPIRTGWRMFDEAFPPGSWMSGRFCRLLAVGTGEHIEGSGVRSVEDIALHVGNALRRADWAEGRFAGKFQSGENGRRVFALEKGRGVCRVTLRSHPVRAVAERAVKEKNGLALLPYERSYWVGVDCFKR